MVTSNTKHFFATAGFFSWTFPAQLALDWQSFRLNDVAILTSDFDSPSYLVAQAMFYGSVTTDSVYLMLCQSGYAILHGNVRCFVFRTRHPNVLKWAERFGAIRLEKLGHNPRFYMDRETSPAWFDLCEHAFERQQRLVKNQPA